MGGGGAVRPERGSAHPHPLAAQVRHVFSQQEPGTRNQKPAGTGAKASRNPEPGTRSQDPGTILHTSEEINVSRIFNVIIRKNKDFIY